MPPVKQNDYMTSRGARVLAAQIADYWRGRGYMGIKVETFSIERVEAAFGVKSNIGPLGWPPKVKV